MPKRTDIHKVLIIGSGPIVIGQACEFDYSGTQACKALRQLGFSTVLVNSNPATIMTDPQTADVTYIEPLNVERLREIIEIERPDALLPNLGGQTGLNLAAELAKDGVLERFGVEVIGIQVDAIERGEDRIMFKQAMADLGIAMPASEPAYSVDEALGIASRLGYPCVVRPAYTMGGTGGGIARDEGELRDIAARGIAASLIGQVLVEESVIGWEELELEVVRDALGQTITVCFIENVDPMGVHTGDSICVAPMLDVDEAVQRRLQEYAYRIVDSIGVIGGCNCQFAHDPRSDRIVVIEINPRTSRSSALASKATGFPIAYVSALLACGLTLDELPYWRAGSLDKYTPSGDYVVVKFPRWAFEKFDGVADRLGTQMRAVGEVMSIGRTYKEALQKAVRSLEIGRFGLGFAKDYNTTPLPDLLDRLRTPTSERQFVLYEALRQGASLDDLYELTGIKPYFLGQMRELVELEERIIACRGADLPADLLRQAKLDGFSDRYIAETLLGVPEDAVRAWRTDAGIQEHWDQIRVSAVDDGRYYYGTYHPASDEPPAGASKERILVLGGGPNRIGQGIEFDYCCVHAAFALRDLGFETIMVNCNPETVSTDFDTATRLYFEPLCVEDVLAVVRREQPLGVIVQFGGQTPLNIAAQLEELGVPILGTSPATIDLAEDRGRFRAVMDSIGVPMPESGTAFDFAGAKAVAEAIGYPVMVRPSFVLGGRGMAVVYDDDQLRAYVESAAGSAAGHPILIDRFLRHALELEADAVCDGDGMFVPAVMQHIELAGIHSGDSACVLPPVSVSDEQLATIHEYTQRIAQALGVVGLMNVQFAIEAGQVYVIEANPRASRTVPMVSKVCGVQMATLATRFMAGSRDSGVAVERAASLRRPELGYYGVKEAVLPFNMFPEADPVLGPEMRSTGETLGLADTFGMAYYKAEEAAGGTLPLAGTVLLSVADKDKAEIVAVARRLAALGFRLLATTGTRAALEQQGIASRLANKYGESKPDVVDLVSGGEVDLVIDTPDNKASHAAGAVIRRAAIRNKVPYVTTTAAAQACAAGIEARRQAGRGPAVRSLQSYLSSVSVDSRSGGDPGATG